MAKYLTSRLLLVFLCKFFYDWAFNINPQLIQFFDMTKGLSLTVLSYILMILVLILGVFALNLLFFILHNTQEISINKFIKNINNKGVLISVMYFIKNFWHLLRENFEIEKKLEKHPNLFLVLFFIFLFFSKGNPILNNYYGIYKEYEIIIEVPKTMVRGERIKKYYIIPLLSKIIFSKQASHE